MQRKGSGKFRKMQGNREGQLKGSGKAAKRRRKGSGMAVEMQGNREGQLKGSGKAAKRQWNGGGNAAPHEASLRPARRPGTPECSPCCGAERRSVSEKNGSVSARNPVFPCGIAGRQRGVPTHASAGMRGMGGGVEGRRREGDGERECGRRRDDRAEHRQQV